MAKLDQKQIPTRSASTEKIMVKRGNITYMKVRKDTGWTGKVIQSSKEECDINNIMKKFERTGQLPDMIKTNPKYGDFSEPLSYQEAQNIVIHANEQFAALSAKVRERFSNNPQKFLEFCHDPENAQEMVKLGLAVKRPAPDKGSASNDVSSGKSESKKASKEAKSESESQK